jgi:predicted ester cyclase
MPVPGTLPWSDEVVDLIDELASERHRNRLNQGEAQGSGETSRRPPRSKLFAGQEPTANSGQTLTGTGACRVGAMSSAGQGKALVERLVGEVVNQGRIGLIDELFTPEMAATAREWFGGFRSSFPDVRMEIVELVEEGDRVVGRFLCSATHSGEWRGHTPTGRRFEDVDEVYFFRFADGGITAGWGIEDTLGRFRQLGLPPS